MREKEIPPQARKKGVMRAGRGDGENGAHNDKEKEEKRKDGGRTTKEGEMPLGANICNKYRNRAIDGLVRARTTANKSRCVAQLWLKEMKKNPEMNLYPEYITEVEFGELGPMPGEPGRYHRDAILAFKTEKARVKTRGKLVARVQKGMPEDPEGGDQDAGLPETPTDIDKDAEAVKKPADADKDKELTDEQRWFLEAQHMLRTGNFCYRDHPDLVDPNEMLVRPFHFQDPGEKLREEDCGFTEFCRQLPKASPSAEQYWAPELAAEQMHKQAVQRMNNAIGFMNKYRWLVKLWTWEKGQTVEPTSAWNMQIDRRYVTPKGGKHIVDMLMAARKQFLKEKRENLLPGEERALPTEPTGPNTTEWDGQREFFDV